MNDVKLSAPSLAGHLERESRRETAHALADYTTNNHRGFYVHAGAALELACKAALARINVLLILDRKSSTWDRDARRVLSSVEITAGDSVRTVGAQEGIARLETLEPRPWADLGAWTNLVFQARNDVVHSGLVHNDEHASHGEAATSFFLASIAIRTREVPERTTTFASQITSEQLELFGSAATLVAAMISDSVDIEKVRVSRLVERHRQRFSALVALDTGYRALVQGASLLSAKDERDLWAIETKCIACDSDAIATGSLEIETQIDYDESGASVGEDEFVLLIFDEVACPVCLLKLSGRQLGLLGHHNAAIHPTATVADVQRYFDDYYDPADYGYDPSDHDGPADYWERDDDPSDYEVPDEDEADGPNGDPSDYWEPDDDPADIDEPSGS